MTVYRNAEKPRRPVMFCQHDNVTYITNKTWPRYLALIEEGKVSKTHKTIFFNSLNELIEFLQANCKVLVNKYR